MGKMPHRRMKQHEQDHPGCMWGFISMFDFRHGGYNRRLLPDKRLRNRAFYRTGFPENMTRSLKEYEYQVDGDDCESTQPMLGAGKPSVKKLMEEDMVVEDIRKQSRIDAENQDADLERQSHKRSSKAYQQKSKPFSISSVVELEDLANDADINNLVREIFSRIQQNSVGGVEYENEQKDNFCVLSEKKRMKIEKQLIEATEVVLREKLISGMPLGQYKKILYSREFKDALETLISHKELFFKLLEDSNSELTRRVNNLLNTEQRKNASQKESDGPHNCKHSLFSRCRVRSQEVVLLSENEGSEAPSSNAVLDPGLEALPNSIAVDNCVPSLKTKSFFSFTEIKRRLKHAMGKDREGVSTKNEMVKNMSRGNQVPRPGGEIVGRMSQSRNPHLEAEIHPKRLSSPRRSDNGSMERFDMTLEPSKYGSQMLTEEGDNEKFSNRRQDLELARKSSSTPDHASSPTFSPALKSSCISPTDHTTLSSPRKSLHSNEDSQALEHEKNVNAAEDLSAQSSLVTSCELDDTLSAKLESWDPSPIISEVKSFDDDEDESQCSVEMSPEGDVKDLLLQTAEVKVQELNTNETEPPRSCDTMECEDTEEVINAITVTDCDMQDENNENCTAPSQIILAPSSLASDKTEHFDDIASKMDKPSPVSVLEPVYLEDEISPPSTKMLRGGLPVTPLQIRYDEDDVSEPDKSTFDKKSSNDNEFKRKYIEEILTLSGFSWDTLYMRSLSSDQLLDLSLYDEDVDILSDQPSNDYKLLFDCLNEVLMDSCARYFGGSQLTSFSKHNIRPIRHSESAFKEIWKGVEWHLLPLSPPRSLEQIVAKDLAKDGRWMDLRFDADIICTEIEDVILQELVEDTVMSCFSEYPDARLHFH